MDSCLSESDLAVLVAGSGASDQISTLLVHVASCDACAARLARRQLAPDGEGAASDTDATVSVQAPGGGGLDAGAPRVLDDAIPGYRILKELHRGGQGVVYQAVQESAKRKVALKVMLEGPFAGAASKRRFEREIELVGSLRHPGIVPIFDSGVAAGRYYYAMEYIRGEPLAAHVRAKKLSIDDTLRLFGKVCEAVDYAHQRGVIHRDLKPSNILVDERGDPHVLDFGLAKIAGAEAAGDAGSMLVSVTGQVMGTLQYMSPEQAAGRPDQVDMRSDVYSLGIVLYELLTGQFPYDVTAQMGTVLTTIQEAEPKSPRSHRRQIDDEVDTIVLKALAKDKDRRYNTAGALGQDVTRYLAGEPIEAKRDSALYVLRKTLRRYKAPATVAAGFALLLVASSIVAWGLFARAESERAKAVAAKAGEERKADELRRTSYFQTIALAQSAYERNEIPRFEELLSACEPSRRGWEWYHLAFLRRRYEAATVVSQPSAIWSVAFHPDGKHVAVGSQDGKIRVWDIRSRILQDTLEGHKGPVWSVSYSWDGKLLASAAYEADRPTARVWDAENAKPLGAFEEHTKPVKSVAFHPSEEWVVSGSGDGTVRVWDARTREVKREFDADPSQVVAFSPDGKWIASGSGEWGRNENTAIFVWAWETDEPPLEIQGHTQDVLAIAFSPDSKRIVTGSTDNTAAVFDVESAEETARFRGHAIYVNAVAFGPEGEWVVSGSGARGGTIRVWSTDTGQETRVFRGQDGAWCLAVSPKGDRIVSGGLDGKLELWDMGEVDEPLTMRGHTALVPSVGFTPNGRFVVSGAGDKTLRVWDASTGRQVFERKHKKRITCVAVSPDGTTVACGTEVWGDTDAFWFAQDPVATEPCPVTLWTLPECTPKGALEGHGASILAVAFSPVGRMLATASADKTVKLWTLATGAARTLPGSQNHLTGVDGSDDPVLGIAFSPDGQFLACTGTSGVVKLWDLNQERVVRQLKGTPSSRHQTLAFRQDREWIAAGGFKGFHVWDMKTGTNLFRGAAPVFSLAFSPDGSRLLTAGQDGTLRLWDTESWSEAMVLHVGAGEIYSAEFSPDGTRIVAGCDDGGVRIWHRASKAQAQALAAPTP